MSITCSICGNKQSGFIQDFPLSNNELGLRICNKCNDEKNKLYYTAESDLEAYKVSRLYFEQYIQSNINKEALEAILQETDQLALEYGKIVEDQRIKNEKIQNEKKRKLDLLNNYMVTTGYNFEGYRIVKYNGVISGEVALGTGFISDIAASFSDFFGVESEKYAVKIEDAKQTAIQKLINKSIDKGDNAIIGVDFDILTFSSNMIGISANGTSVKVEKSI